MPVFQQFRSFNRVVQVLLTNQLAINVAFFMLVPFLPAYLTGELGMAGWMVGLVVGARNLSQQGLFVIGGTLSDRIGYRPVIIAGCAMRSIGFLLFGLTTSLPGVLLAAVLSGLAGSLFAPAIRAYLSVSAETRRVEAFALLNIFGQAGLLTGPIIGAALLGFDFRVLCFLSAGIFFALFVLQLLYMPARAGGQANAASSVLSDWKEALTNRAFVLFSLGMLGYFTLYNQLYLGIALEVARVMNSDAGIGLVFTVSGLLTIFGQTQVTAYCRRRFRPLAAIVLGMALMGIAFVPLLLAAPYTPLPANAFGAGLPPAASQALAVVANLGPILLCTVLLTVGIMVCLPFSMDFVPELAGGRMVGTYFGLFYVFNGLGSVLGNLVVGASFDVGRAIGLLGLPWLLLALTGLGSAAAIALLDRRGLLSRPAAGDLAAQ